MARASGGNGSEEAWGALRVPQQQVSQQLQKPIATAIYFFFLFPCPFCGVGRNSRRQRYCEVPRYAPSTLCLNFNIDAVDFACSFINPISWLQWKFAVALQ